MRMRQVEHHALAPRDPHDAAVGIGELHRAPGTLADASQAACGEDQHEHDRIADQEVRANRPEHRRLLGRWQLAGTEVRPVPRRIGVQRDHFACCRMQAEHCQRRDQDGRREEKRLPCRKVALEPQPVVKADAPVRPRDEEERVLEPALPGVRDPVVDDHLRVGKIAIEERGLQPHANEVRDEQEGDRHAQHQLGDLGGRIAELAARIERPQAQSPVRDRRRVEHGRHERVSPELHVQVEAVLHRIERNEPERMVREMRQQVAEEDQPAGDAHLPRTDAASGERAGTPQEGRQRYAAGGHLDPAAVTMPAAAIASISASA
jgi:hypothetical protein